LCYVIYSKVRSRKLKLVTLFCHCVSASNRIALTSKYAQKADQVGSSRLETTRGVRAHSLPGPYFQDHHSLQSALTLRMALGTDYFGSRASRDGCMELMDHYHDASDTMATAIRSAHLDVALTYAHATLLDDSATATLVACGRRFLLCSGRLWMPAQPDHAFRAARCQAVVRRRRSKRLCRSG
jgi:hypothetical protein